MHWLKCALRLPLLRRWGLRVCAVCLGVEVVEGPVSPKEPLVFYTRGVVVSHRVWGLGLLLSLLLLSPLPSGVWVAIGTLYLPPERTVVPRGGVGGGKVTSELNVLRLRTHLYIGI